MTKLFISYSRKDADRVDPLIARLQSAGYEFWLDTLNLRGGEQWKRNIVEAVENCDHFLIMLSPSAATSENVLKELNLAGDAHKTIIPVEVEYCDIPASMKYHLVGLQIISFIKEPDIAFEKLLGALGDERAQEMGSKTDRNGQIGDVHAPSVSEVAGALTPVPGGVGPLTIALLLRNTVRAAAGSR